MTLIEMLIAMAIFTTVIALVGQSYQYYVVGFTGNDQRLSSYFKQIKKSLAWQSTLSSAFYYYVPVAPEQQKVWFEGGKTELSWFATSGINVPGEPVAAWVGIENNEFLYCEQALKENLFVSQKPTKSSLCSEYQLKIEDVRELTFSYFRWPDVESRADYYSGESAIASATTVKKPRWFSETSGVSANLIPMFVKVDLTYLDDSTDTIWVELENNDVHRQAIFSYERG